MSQTTRSMTRSALESVQDTTSFNALLDAENATNEQGETYINDTVAESENVQSALESIDAAMLVHLDAVAALESAATRLDQFSGGFLDASSRSVLSFSLESTALSVPQVDMSEEMNKIKNEEQDSQSAGSKIVEMAKKILKVIVDFMKSMWRRLQDFVNKLLGAGIQLTTRAKRIKADAAKLNLTAAPKNGTIESEEVFNSLRVGEHMPANASQIVDVLTQVSKSAATVDDALLAAYKRDLTHVLDSLRTHNIDALNAALESEINFGAQFKEVKSYTQNARRFISQAMPGNRYIAIDVQARIYSGVFFGVDYKASVLTVSEVMGGPGAKDETIVSTQLQTMSGDDINKIGDNVTELVKNLAKSRNIMTEARKLTDQTEPGRLQLKSPTGATILSNFHKRYSTVGRASVLFNTHLVKCGLALCKWAELSMAEYEAAA